MSYDSPPDWSPLSWKARLAAQQVVYADREGVERAVQALSALPPLVTSFEIERLKSQIADAQHGRRFLLQGGDCAEQMSDCRPDSITAKLKILLQMSLVLVYGARKPVIRVGRLAGQYAKPRSSTTETRSAEGGASKTLPSYFGDLVNGSAFDEAARRPDPMRMVDGYKHAAVTLNFIRALMDAGFADLHHPEYWDLGLLKHAGLPDDLRAQYAELTQRIAEGLRFMEAVGDRSIEELSRMEFFTSHEGLNLLYESAQTRTVPRRKGYYNLTTHLPWLGERTRGLDGAHVEYFRGIRNPIGVKIGARTTRGELLGLLRVLNPQREPGRVVLIHRMGVHEVARALPPLVEAVKNTPDAGPVLWVCDPMHGNAITTSRGVKTRSFDHIMGELAQCVEIHRACGTTLGGVHLELTGEDVTECVGGKGGTGVSETDLERNYASACDPRLNYEQSLELAFLLARLLGKP
ncbi:MAG TPA: 3-deoxy-7-phosphoheptulonate synthase class II [Phycisphaerales bacterium]|nr:3-deoxy-7-phosphoheptulonate synthase class II [Phycisphaerales bacterium]